MEEEEIQKENRNSKFGSNDVFHSSKVLPDLKRNEEIKRSAQDVAKSCLEEIVEERQFSGRYLEDKSGLTLVKENTDQLGNARQGLAARDGSSIK